MNRKTDRSLRCQACLEPKHFRQLVHCDACGTLQCFAHASYAGAPKGSVARYAVGNDGGRAIEVRRGTCDACAAEKKRLEAFAEAARALVVHCKKAPHDAYVGRPTVWGNPYVIGRDGSRERVVALYERRLLGSPELLARLPELRGRVLGCWCAPKLCHAHVLACYANAVRVPALDAIAGAETPPPPGFFVSD